MAYTMTWPNDLSFDDLHARIDEFSRVEDDDRATNRSNFKRDRGNDRKDEGNGKKNWRDDKDEGKKSSGEAFKGLNTVCKADSQNYVWNSGQTIL